MNSNAFGAFLDIESAPVTDLDPILQKSAVSATSPNVIELDELNWGAQHNGPQSPGLQSEPVTPFTGSQTPAALITTANPSRPHSPSRHDITHMTQTWNDPPMNKWRVLSCCLIYFSMGLNDSAAGALIPYMETHYEIGYAIVSLIFVTQAAGFLGAAFFTDMLKARIGTSKLYVVSQSILVAAYAVICGTPPYALVTIAFFLNGWATAINIALNNVFIANLGGSTVILGASQGMYGVGGIIGPFIATSLVSQGISWSRFYILPLILYLACGFFSYFTFRNIENEPVHQLQAALEATAYQQAGTTAPSKGRLLIQALKYSVTIIGALFTFAYQGAEVSISGWVISFLINERSGDPAKVGFVTAGFWGGITIGRFTLAPMSARWNQKVFVHIVGVCAIGFQLLVWLVPNVIGDSVAVALVGFVLGPIAPCSMAYFVRLIPRSIQTVAVGFISSAGSSGGAAAPFITGLLAQAKGTWVLHPVCICLFVLMGACWYMLPSVEKRTE